MNESQFPSVSVPMAPVPKRVRPLEAGFVIALRCRIAALEARLRACEELAYIGEHHFPEDTWKSRCVELESTFASRTESLEAALASRAVMERENEELRAALKPFAEYVAAFDNGVLTWEDDHPIRGMAPFSMSDGRWFPMLKHCRRAGALLARHPGQRT